MSAAKKLKELSLIAPTSVWYAKRNATLARALPQIMAIIEAAEELPMLFDVIEGSTIKTLSFVPLLDELDKALT